MSLGDHLRELRRRVTWAALGVLIGAGIGWWLYPQIFDLLLEPVQAIQGGGGETTLNFSEVLGPFDTKVRVSLFVGLLLSSPWWLLQFWLYVAPGLTRREKGIGLAFVLTGVPLFVGGAYLAWSVLPRAVAILTAATPEGAWNLVGAAAYLTFVMQFMFIFGVAFLLPLIMVALTSIGLVRARTWRNGWRWAIIVIAIFAAFATPSPDALSMFFMAVPMAALYGFALLICLWIDRRRDRALAAREREWEAEREARTRPEPPPGPEPAGS